MQIQQNLGENKAILRLFELLLDNKILFFIKLLSVKSPCLSSPTLYTQKNSLHFPIRYKYGII